MNRIKHTLLLMLALILMLDLAEDGCFGQAPFDLPVALTKTSGTTLHHGGWGQVNFRYKCAPAHLRPPPSQANYQPVSFRVQTTLEMIDYLNIRSSGGIPR
jgi:hypothetical protein